MIVGWRVFFFYCCWILCFALFYSSWICRSKGDHVGTVNVSWENRSFQVCEAFSWHNCWQRGLSPLCGMPSLGEWYWAVGKRKQSTQGRARKQATFSQGLWCACLQPPTSHLTSHTDFPQQGTVMWKQKSNKPLPLQVDCDLYHIKGSLTRTVLGSRKGSSLTDMIMLTFFFFK